MNFLYPTEEVNLSKMFRLSFRQHFLAVKYLFLPILLLLFAKPLFQSLDVASLNPYLLLASKYFYFFIFILLFSPGLLSVHAALNNQHQSYLASARIIMKNFFNIFGAIFCYFLGFVLIALAMHFLMKGIRFFDPNAPHEIKLFLLLVEFSGTLIFLCMFFFSYALSIIDQTNILKSFRNSMMLSEKNKFGIFVLLFIISMLYSLIKGGADQIDFIQAHHLILAYDFFALIVFVPLFANLLLLLVNDSKKQILEEMR